jgi:hypothetical protein
VEAKTGFHGKVVKRDGGRKQECVRCHTDHYGENFNIVRWEPSRDDFDHRQTGYVLSGKHARVECSRCHRPDNILKTEQAAIAVKDKRRTYLGLSERCSTCHADEHRRQLGADCARCHTSFETWKQPSKFDHSLTKYTLTGLHQKVKCAECHKPITEAAAKPYTRYTGIPFGSCADCHRDPHRGAFTAACDSCHTDDGWKRLKTSGNFDHSKTKFPLTGKHAKQGCLECHKSSNFKEPLAHRLCSDCHRKNNPHRDQFEQDCESCHTTDGYKPSTFTVSRHQQSRYRLIGRHAAVECSGCHKPPGKDANYHPAYTRCMDCHKDAHGAQFVSAPYENRCETCHTEAGFRPSTFSLIQHRKTRFALTGSHAATPCSECHKPTANVVPAGPARFHFEDRSCTGCHSDPHRSAGAPAAKVVCDACHTTRAWKQVERFDHDATGFVLTGAHRSVECKLCHRREILTAQTKSIPFPGAPRNCAGCHEDIHAGQFSSTRVGNDCGSCHTSVAWKPARFDHETRARFSLAGAHRGVPCRSCHTHRETIQGRSVLLYARAPSQCSACHGSK